jgi:hypothetical protein
MAASDPSSRLMNVAFTAAETVATALSQQCAVPVGPTEMRGSHPSVRR